MLISPVIKFLWTLCLYLALLCFHVWGSSTLSSGALAFWRSIRHNSTLNILRYFMFLSLVAPKTDLGHFTWLFKNSQRESLQVNWFLILIFGATLQLCFWKCPLSTSPLPRGLIFSPLISFHPTPFLSLMGFPARLGQPLPASSHLSPWPPHDWATAEQYTLTRTNIYLALTMCSDCVKYFLPFNPPPPKKERKKEKKEKNPSEVGKCFLEGNHGGPVQLPWKQRLFSNTVKKLFLS